MMEPICTCPRCGDQRPLSEMLLAAIDDQSLLTAVQAAASLPPPLADGVIRYMRMFGGIRPATYAKLLADIAQAIQSGTFVFRRRDYRASPALWLSALTDCLASPTVRLPLKAANGHNFLYAIAAEKADKAAAAAERSREEHARYPVLDRSTTPTQAPEPDARRAEIDADIRHWQQLATLRPHDPDIAAALAAAIAARAKLAAEKSNAV